MSNRASLLADLEAAMTGAADCLSAADLLCLACVELLHVDGAAISLVHEGVAQETFGSSSEFSRRLDECSPSARAPASTRSPAAPGAGSRPCTPGGATLAFLHAAVLGAGINAVFALPATVAATGLGVLDLFRRSPGPLSADDLAGGLFAAELAPLPLLDLLTTDWPDADDGGADSPQLTMERVEVYQATGMIMAQLDVGPTEALVRLRAHAFVSGQTASEVAWEVVERRLSFGPGESRLDRGDGRSPR